MNEYKEGQVGFGDIIVQFASIERAEEKRNQANMEADQKHKSAVHEWDVLYDAIKKLHEKYASSAALSDSKMGGLFPVKPIENLEQYMKDTQS